MSVNSHLRAERPVYLSARQPAVRAAVISKNLIGRGEAILTSGGRAAPLIGQWCGVMIVRLQVPKATANQSPEEVVGALRLICVFNF